MNDQLKLLYEQIKEQKISPEDALKQIRELKNQYNIRFSAASGLQNEYVLHPETYDYDEPYVRDHTVHNQRVLLGVTHGSLALNAFFKLFPQERSVLLHQLSFVKPVTVNQGRPVEVLVKPVQIGPNVDFQVIYRDPASGSWNLTATGNLQKTGFEERKIDVASYKASLGEYPRIDPIYNVNPAVGFGDSFKIVTELYRGVDQVLARVQLKQTVPAERHTYDLHPRIINSAFMAFSLLLESSGGTDSFLPFGIQDIYFRKTNGLEQCWLLMKLVKNSGEMVIFDFDIINDQSQVIAHFSGCSLKRLRLNHQALSPDQSVFDSFEQSLQSEESDQDMMVIDGDLSSRIQKYLTNKLAKIVRNRAKLANIELNLMDLGLESTQLVALTREIEAETGIELNPTLFFEYPNIKELSEFFIREHQDSFAQILGENSAQVKIVHSSTRPPVWQAPRKPTSARAQSVEPSSLFSKLPSTIKSPPESGNDDIAIIGMHGIFADASNLDQFWENLWSRKDVIKEIPIDHWDYRPWYDPNPQAKDRTYSKWGSFIEDVDKFDAGFFNISPREAEWIDPQLRLLLQCIYATGEDAGYINELRGTNTGVFVGICFHDYMDRIIESGLPVDPYIETGNSQTIIANRVSFLFDFTGPSVAFDTACSSSLVALHNACCALKNNECGMAFVGGVNLLLSSYHYRYFSSIGALSPTGRCHTFDEAADGYVPGECIASILLKPLRQAQKDGDHIYGVIKGSAALHGGYTPSLTAPSIKGEENVILKAWEAAGIHPETLSFIEAHGTGTKLGDPIEINSLKKAFQRFTQKEGFCAIGSVKANIGHAEGAAGIAGVIKIILQMKHRRIPAMPLFKKLNPYIQLDKSAIYINQEGQEWRTPAGTPRRAGVNSFGFSGAYAHVVIEEYCVDSPAPQRIPITSQNPVIIILSAKNEDRLQAKIQQLLTVIKERQLTDADLPDIAHILQVGREIMEARLGLIVSSIKELEEKLKGFLEGREDVTDLFHGEVQRTQENLAVFTADEDLQKAIDTWVTKGKYGKLLDLWVKGLIFDWNKLYGNMKPRYLNLPTYPFAQERYWIAENHGKPGEGFRPITKTSASIHPLLHQNTSNFSEQRFSSTFTGEEFYLVNHVVNSRRIFPGVAYLEMAREAVCQSLGVWGDSRLGIRLKNVVWIQPIAFSDHPVEDQAADVHITLYPESSGEIAFKIYSTLYDNQFSGENGLEPVVHSQGVAILDRLSEKPPLHIEALLAKCSQGGYTSTQWYDAIGPVYGPGFQGVERIYLGPDYTMAKLALPACVADTWEQFVLHPSLMDSAVQVPLILAIMSTGEPALPFALEELEIHQKCAPTMWAWVRNSNDNIAGEKVRRFDVDLCDEQGNICITMKGLSSRALETQTGPVESPENPGFFMLEPVWREIGCSGGETDQESATPIYDQYLAVLCDWWNTKTPELLRERLEAQLSSTRWLLLQSKQKNIDERFLAYATQLFEEIKNILKEKPKVQTLIQVVVPMEPEQQLFSGCLGLLKTAHLENSKLMVQLIEVSLRETGAIRKDPAPAFAREIVSTLQEGRRRPGADHIRYQDGRWMVMGWNEIGAPRETAGIPWKERGIYLITGGTGSLGLIFAKEITDRVEGATLILLDQFPASEEKQTRIKELESGGAKVVFRCLDITDKKAVAGLMQSLRKDHGGLHGIIHCAGVIRDSLILNKTKEEFQAVLTPKVSGLVNLDESSKDFSLDFFILFSSIAGSFGNPGQADYSTANAFMDAYARYRNYLVALKQRVGKTLALNWPLWKEGGMRLDAASETMMRQNTGMIPMETATGIQALYRCFNLVKDQAMVLEGDIPQIKNYVFPTLVPPGGAPEIQPQSGKTAKVSEAAPVSTGIDNGSLQEKANGAVARIISKVLKIRAEGVNPHMEFNEYGFDSITLTEFANKLNQEYGLKLTPTIFFEYPNLARLTEYLVREYRLLFEEELAVQTKSAIPVAAPKERMEENLVHHRQPVRFSRTPMRTVYKSEPMAPEPIAIIGMSGKFPQAQDLTEFWENLAGGRDCITEIPKDRWDWEDYYGDSAQEANKTNIKWGGFIDGVAEFDPFFFGISPREAELMDPQQRLLMTYIWKVIEDAGYSAQSLSGTKTAIFVGTGNSGYSGLLARARIPLEGYSSTGMVPSVGPNRMSYFLNLHGPSEPIETACSSSLIAIHRAMKAIETGDCEMAIVGGINSMVTPDFHISFGKAGMLSEDGRCKTFSSKANGYVRGEGVGMLFLKKLKAAEEDGDHIYGIIRGSAENHGGRANSLTAPNPKAQAELLVTAYTKAGIDPRTVTYIEAHGTGTPLGDPIEINALKAAFKELVQATGDPRIACSYCGLGSVKTNIGHLEYAAGVAGVIKLLLQLQHKLLVRSLHCDTINPYIQLEDSPFYIVQENQEWKAILDAQGKTLPLRAGVSSFGFGGANAHIVIEEYLPKVRRSSESVFSPGVNRTPAFILLSAKSEAQLKEQARRLLVAIREQQFTDSWINDIAYTLQVGREAMEERFAVIVGSIRELQEKLSEFIDGREEVANLFRGQVKRNKETLALFAADEDMAKTIDAWVMKGKYEKLLALWVKGLIFDWEKLYRDLEPEARPRRVSLPTYPFARERYWIPENQAGIPEKSSPDHVSFDEAYYSQLIDEIMIGSISSDTAVRRVKEFSNKPGILKTRGRVS